jgi:hypothetical protein
MPIDEVTHARIRKTLMHGGEVPVYIVPEADQTLLTKSAPTVTLQEIEARLQALRAKIVALRPTP